MENRWNSEGMPRHEILWALSQPRIVKKAIRESSCLICCNSKINEAGLCDICWATLDDQELNIATKWVAGSGP